MGDTRSRIRHSTPVEEEQQSSLAEKKSSSRNRACHVNLEFMSMEGRESHWQVDQHGKAVIPSPIPIFPKPLALAYCNFVKHYADFKFTVTEKRLEYPFRLEVANQLIATLLQNYFSGPRFLIRRLDEQPENLVQGVPSKGTQYWVVLKKDQSAIFRIDLILVIITDPERGSVRSAQLELSAYYVDGDRVLGIDGRKTRNCSVVSMTPACLDAGSGKPFLKAFNGPSIGKGIAWWELLPAIARDKC